MKNKKYHSFGTIPRYHLKIADRGKMIDTPYTQIGDRSLSCRGVGTSIQSDGVQLVIYNNVYDFLLIRQSKALIVLIFVSLKL
jgi:hypothetical protein